MPPSTESQKRFNAGCTERDILSLDLVFWIQFNRGFIILATLRRIRPSIPVRDRLDGAQAEAVERINQTEAGEPVASKEVEAEWLDIVLTIRTRLLAIPARARRDTSDTLRSSAHWSKSCCRPQQHRR